MKRLFAFCTVLPALLLALACSSGKPDAVAEADIYSIKCSIDPFQPEVATKLTTVMSDAGVSSVWNHGDAIGVFPDTGGDQVSFTLASGAGTGTCVFDGQGWGLLSYATYSAYYPYSPDNYGDFDARKNIKLSYSGQSQAEKNTFAVGQFDYLACTNAVPSFSDPADPNGACTFNFRHLGALLILDVTFPIAATLATLELDSEANLFTIAATVDLSQATPAANTTLHGNSLVLDVSGMAVSAGETVRFYMMAAPDNLNGEVPVVKVTTADRKEMSKSLGTSYNLQAGKAYTFEVTLDAPVAPEIRVPVAGEGLTIYNTTGNFNYRYGPSIIVNDDGSIDAWFASPGSLVSGSGMADVFTWRHSTDGGQTWTAEKVVLTGSAKPAEDWWSVCDPGAACFDGYYYLAYTSTTNTSSSSGLQGLENNCYIARGTSPSGPWEKWNGTGWGGNPKPIVKYMDGSEHNDGPAGKWGIGEPSIVVKDQTIYLYYTYDAGGTPVTKVATAPRGNANWPGSLSFHGTAVDKAALAASEGVSADNPDTSGLLGSYDSCDVKYVEDHGLFYAFHTSWRLTQLSRLSVWTSADGLTFTYLGDITGNVVKYAHNMGVSGDGLGHVNLSKPQYVSYAYRPVDQPLGPNGRWSTYWSELSY